MIIFYLTLSFCLTKFAVSQTPLNPDTEKCFENIGCFNNKRPFDEIGLFDENDPEVIKTEFFLYTPDNQTQAQSLSYKDIDTIKNSGFKRDLPLKVVIHGYANDWSNPNTDWMRTMRAEFFKNGQFNVLIVAWGKGSIYQKYNIAAANTRIVGKELSLILNQLDDEFKPTKFSIHCIGASLGAHTCAYAANSCNTFFDRITALDPANLYFENAYYKVRVDPSDAKIVDVIHTDIGEMVTTNGAFGMKRPTGTVDFYVNGGKNQPGCPAVVSTAPLNPTTNKGCHHRRATEYFIESINSYCLFTAYKCDSWEKYSQGDCSTCGRDGCTMLGYYADSFNFVGSFYVATNSKSPYCGTNFILELSLSKDSLKSQGQISLKLDSIKSPQTFSLTTSETTLKASDQFKKLFVSSKDILQTKDNQLIFDKKSALFDFSNSAKIKFDKIKLTNLDIAEVYSQCIVGTQLEDGKAYSLQLKVQEDPNQC